MTLKTAVNVLLLTMLAVGVYWLYGMGRTSAEVVGFHIGVALHASLLALILLSPLLLVYGSFLLIRKKKVLWLKKTIFVAATWLIATAVCETQILVDENSFAHESQQADSSGKDFYSRDRAWPNRSASLIWIRGDGIHATD